MAASPAVPLRVLALSALTVAVSSVGWSGAAHAQSATDSATADALFNDARALMTKGNYADACPKLEESQRLDPGSGTLLNLGDCFEHQGRVASAWTTFLDAAAAARVAGNADRERVSRERAAAIETRVARMTIRVVDEKIGGLEVRRNGVVVRSAQWSTAIPTDPGAYTVSATAPGHMRWQTSVTLRDGVTGTVMIPALQAATSTELSNPGEPARPNETAPSAPVGETIHPSTGGANALGTQHIAALAAGGVGIAGVVVGTVFGLQAISKNADADTRCNGLSCSDPQGVADASDAHKAGTISTVAFAVGAAGLAAGAVLWFTAKPAGTAARLGVGVGSVQVEGVW